MPNGCEITVIITEGPKRLKYNLKPNGINVIVQEGLMDSYIVYINVKLWPSIILVEIFK